ncbi:hypothetical protein LGN19_06030 [Burkholderia sp. AU30198]|uniref:hypothetical protein n=1 Tax=Burkholderia sp. AU30198 TaxID=2879627 RepID=UPI001CF21028|nr:hypothetical protein [Burkholderia sp. AU30198]MCA8293350.1 hypothetical protein [Burkholderia sp. AU30198]
MNEPSFIQRWRNAIMSLGREVNQTPIEPKPMTDEQWLRRCAARFVRRGNVDPHIAASYAEAAFENVADFGFENDPEGAADCEMSYWSE